MKLWSTRVSNDLKELQSYANEINSLDTQMDRLWGSISSDLKVMIDSLENKLQDLKDQLQKDIDNYKKQQAFLGVLNVLTGLASAFSCISTSVGCGEMVDSMGHVIQDSISAVNGFDISKCHKCEQDQEFIDAAQQAETDIAAITSEAAAARALEPQLVDGKDLPSMLPNLVASELAMDRVRAAVDLFQQELIQQTNASSAYITDLEDWCQHGLMRDQQFFTYYSVAARTQNDQGQLNVMNKRLEIAKSALVHPTSDATAVSASAQFVRTQQQAQASLVVKSLSELVKQ